MSIDNWLKMYDGLPKNIIRKVTFSQVVATNNYNVSVESLETLQDLDPMPSRSWFTYIIDCDCFG